MAPKNLLSDASLNSDLAHQRKPIRVKHQEKAASISIDHLVSHIAAIDRCLYDTNKALLAAQYVIPGRIQIIFTNERPTRLGGVRYYDRSPVICRLYQKKDGAYCLRGVRPSAKLEAERPKGKGGKLPGDRQTVLILRNIEKLLFQREQLCKTLGKFRYDSEMVLRKSAALLRKQPKILTDLESQIEKK